MYTWYFSSALVIATISPLQSWQIPALRRCPLTPYFNKLLFREWRAISSYISIAWVYLNTKGICLFHIDMVQVWQYYNLSCCTFFLFTHFVRPQLLAIFIYIFCTTHNLLLLKSTLKHAYEFKSPRVRLAQLLPIATSCSLCLHISFLLEA